MHNLHRHIKQDVNVLRRSILMPATCFAVLLQSSSLAVQRVQVNKRVVFMVISWKLSCTNSCCNNFYVYTKVEASWLVTSRNYARLIRLSSHNFAELLIKNSEFFRGSYLLHVLWGVKLPRFRDGLAVEIHLFMAVFQLEVIYFGFHVPQVSSRAAN